MSQARRSTVSSGPWGEDLDRLLGPGQFVVVEPDMFEFVCADRDQMLLKLDECSRRGVGVVVRWKRADGSMTLHAGPPPPGWGLEESA